MKFDVYNDQDGTSMSPYDCLLTTTISQAIDSILFHCNYNDDDDDDNGGITIIRT